MIYCKELNLSFETKEAMFTELQKHKVSLKALKKSTVKYSDGFDCLLTENDTVNNVVKANNPVNEDVTQLLVKVAMNTTNIMDSHCDVHIPGLWKRTLDHSNKKLHLQEHKREFDKVISNDATAYTRQLAWKTLGAEYEGTTQALIFESLVKSSRNPLMFEQYKNGWVTNHSVGMEYVDIVLCVNSEERWWAEEKENFDKYYPQVVNKEDVDNQGYFWAVLSALRGTDAVCAQYGRPATQTATVLGGLRPRPRTGGSGVRTRHRIRRADMDSERWRRRCPWPLGQPPWPAVRGRRNTIRRGIPTAAGRRWS